MEMILYSYSQPHPSISPTLACAKMSNCTPWLCLWQQTRCCAPNCTPWIHLKSAAGWTLSSNLHTFRSHPFCIHILPQKVLQPAFHANSFSIKKLCSADWCKNETSARWRLHYTKHTSLSTASVTPTFQTTTVYVITEWWPRLTCVDYAWLCFLCTGQWKHCCRYTRFDQEACVS